MKTIKLQDISPKEIISGVYKITFPNGKVYIGISNNIVRRMNEHNSDFRNNLPIEHAIQKYGKITEFVLLEAIAPENRDYMREREKYWIAKYKSTIDSFGYNVSTGGDGASHGSENHEAKFSEEQIQEIYNELRQQELTLTELAKKYEVHLSTMSSINNGKTYFHSTEKYPIRNGNKKIKKGVFSYQAKLDEKTLLQIIELLKENNESMRQIAQKFQLTSTLIQNINQGKTYYQINETYPLRQSKTGARKLSQEQVKKVITLIQNYPKKSLSEIGRELNISSKTISGINCGRVYRQPLISYPIRN